jgi:histidinol-phosphate/aromatic aminotransferase/cobyric acid decarboxylase-like protein
MPLAIDSYRHVDTLVDDPNLLNLSWTLDEREFLTIDLRAAVAGCLAQELRSELAWINQYFVKDPYGAGVVGPAVESFFSVGGLAANVTCGAGVNALLHALAAWSVGGTVLLPSGVYPDFPHWVQQGRGRASSLTKDAGQADWQAALQRQPALLVFLERPSFLGERWRDVLELRQLCTWAAEAGVAVLIDESNANYCPPSFSAVPLTIEVDNLAVLRGFSKAYGLGGIRLGYCVSSVALTPRVRAAIPPLQASSLSLLVARTVLERGDITASLRQRICEMKQRIVGLLESAGITGMLVTSESLPYVVFADAPQELTRRGNEPGVALKRHPLWSSERGLEYVHRFSVPLRANRMAALEEWMGRLGVRLLPRLRDGA